MGCCRHGQRMVVADKKINTNTLCSGCSLEMKQLYQLSAEQQTAGKTGEATVLVTLACPRCAVLNSYVITLVRKYDRSAITPTK
jgi:hypothetical protein